MADSTATARPRAIFFDARELDFARLVGHLSTPQCLSRSRHIRNQLLNLFLHRSFYPAYLQGQQDRQEPAPVPEAERWSFLTRNDARARMFAFGDVPRHLFSDPARPQGAVDDATTESACWGLTILTSPQTSLVDPSKEVEDPPIFDLWLSRRCELDGPDDHATFLATQVLTDFLPGEVRRWMRDSETKSGGHEQPVFGYCMPVDIMPLLHRLTKVIFDHRGESFYLPARECWPRQAPQPAKGSGLVVARVEPGDIYAMWEGHGKHYSEDYISSRSHISCCVRERLREKDGKDEDERRAIGWSAAHSALAIAATFVIPEWRGRLIDVDTEEETGSGAAGRACTGLSCQKRQMRVSDLVIRHISREIVRAQLFALWACGLSSSPLTWEPTSLAPTGIKSSLDAQRNRQGNIKAWEDIVVVTTESEPHKAAAYRMWDRLGFDNLADDGGVDVAWIAFSVTLP